MEDLDLCAGWVRPENEDSSPFPPGPVTQAPPDLVPAVAPGRPLMQRRRSALARLGGLTMAHWSPVMSRWVSVGRAGRGRSIWRTPRPRLSFGTSHSWALQGSQGRAGGLITCWGIEIWLPQVGQGLGGSQPQ